MLGLVLSGSFLSHYELEIKDITHILSFSSYIDRYLQIDDEDQLRSKL